MSICGPGARCSIISMKIDFSIKATALVASITVIATILVEVFK